MPFSVPERRYVFMTIDIYSQYFNGECLFNDIKRHAVRVMLQVTSECGNVEYKVFITFFPHNDEEDYMVTYDAVAEEILFSGKGRRSKKKEAIYLEQVKEVADRLAKSLDGTIDWDNPLRDAQYA